MAADEQTNDAAALAAATPENGDLPAGLAALMQQSPREPGGVSLDELQTLYSAAEIKVRALNEQIEARDKVLASWGQLGTRLMEMLGVDTVEAIIPAVEKLSTNRQQRRAGAKSRSRKKKTEGG